MEETALQVQMLGKFSIRNGNCEINDNDNRSKKVWLLLAYMIYYRARTVSPEEMVTLLWGEDVDRSSNPLNALKTMFHRARSLLEALGDRVGHQLIIRREGTYAWNTELPLTLDIDEFERLCREGENTKTPQEQAERWLAALELYHGDFLERLSSDLWVTSISAYYHNYYVQTALKLLPLLEEQGQWETVIHVCRAAVVQEPYMEEFYSHLMRALLQMEDYRGAAATYEEMSELLFSSFGVRPSDEVHALYREAIRSVNDHTVASGVILEQLREPESGAGALFCDYDIFKAIYHSFARAVARSGDAVHLSLISITDENGRDLNRRSLERVVGNLRELICRNLRKGDVAARCSVSQFILLLPQANYENSCMVTDRVLKAFARQYPHSPAQLHASVHPLEPNL